MLGVQKSTLYAYVSRGLVRSRAVAGTRRREYVREDVEQMLVGKQARRDPKNAARATLGTHGLPVLQSALTCIADGRAFLRGQDLVGLARTHRFEDVLALLWDAWPEDVLPPRSRTRSANLPLLARLQQRLAEVDALDPAARSLNPASVRRIGAAALRRMVGEVCGTVATLDPIADQLARAWGLHSSDPVDAALVLCSDHGLNVSTFAARCVASAGASVPMVISAGLGALSGRRHGGESQRVAAMLDATGPIATVLRRIVERDGRLPGFGHPLYPEGDPRARELLQRAVKGSPRRRTERFITSARKLFDVRPNLDLGLVTLCRGAGLPPEAPWALFALGRTAGWVGHALEQYATGSLIRPRAEYVGPRPRR